MNNPALAYTIAQASERTNITATKLWQAVSDGQLKSFRIGRSRLVSEHALNMFIDKLEKKEIEITHQRYDSTKTKMPRKENNPPVGRTGHHVSRKSLSGRPIGGKESNQASTRSP